MSGIAKTQSKKKIKSGSILKLLRYASPYKAELAAMIIFSSIYAVASLFTPVITGMCVDCIVGAGDVDFAGLKVRVGILGGIICVVLVTQWLASYFAQRVAYNTVRDLRDKAFESLSRAPISYIDSMPHGDLVSRLSSDADQVADGVIQSFTQLLTGIITIIGTLCFMFALNPMVALAVVAFTPVSLVVSFIIAKLNYKHFTAQSRLRGELTAITDEAVTNHDLIQLFDYGGKIERDFKETNESLRQSGFRAMFGSAMVNPATRFINNLAYVIVALLGALIVIRSGGAALTVGTLTGFLLYANQYARPFNEISGVITEMQTSLSSASRVIKVIEVAPEDDGLTEAAREELNAVQDLATDNSSCAQAGEEISALAPEKALAPVAALKSFEGEVAFKDMCFAYTEDRPLIENLTLDIPRGTRVAVVGPTGCGKTTLINLLMRFYDPTSGDIHYDGTPRGRITRAAVRSSVGMVLQDTWIFHGTVRENIAYGKPDATQQEIEAAAVSAHIDGFISRLEKGYDTVIDDDDSISQGQKQLICIARIMLADPPVLILDEATSNLDARTEVHVQHAFKRLTSGGNRNKTCFVVAHRLSTIQNSDIILVMNKGSIIERGTHDELMQARGFYYNLYNSQFKPRETA